MNTYKKQCDRSGYALVVVLSILMVSMLIGAYFLKKSALLDKNVQMALDEKDLQQRAIYNFNQLAQQVRVKVEAAINDSITEEDLLSSELCSNSFTCVREAIPQSEATEMGISYVIECRGEGTPLLSTRCTTSKYSFPKELLIRMQQRNPNNPDEVLYATGEVRYQPVPLNAYALALTAAKNVNFGPGTYDGNIAINLSNSEGEKYQVHLYPGENDPINFNGIVTVSAGQVANPGDSTDEAIVFHTGPNKEVNYVGFRNSSQLGSLRESFVQAVEDSLVNPENQIIEGNPQGYTPDIPLPEVDGTIITSAYELNPLRKSLLKLSAATTGGNCGTNARFEESFKKVVRVKMALDYTEPPAGYQFEAGHDYLIEVGCRTAPHLCSQGNACMQMDDGSGKICTVVREEVNTIFDGQLPDNSIIVSQNPEVILDRYQTSDNYASGCGTNFAVYAPNGNFRANVGYKNVQPSVSGVPSEGRLKAAFVSGLNVTTPQGAVVFHEDTIAENGFSLGSIKNTGEVPEDGPTLRFEATIVGLGLASKAVEFDNQLVMPSSGSHLLGKFLSKGGQIAAQSSDFRTVYTSGPNAGQVVAGFGDVEHIFLLNDSPVLSSREFAANLDATVRNFNIDYPEARAGLARVGLGWVDTVPNINYVDSATAANFNWFNSNSSNVNPVFRDTSTTISIPGKP